MNNVLGVPFLDNQLLAKSGIKIKKKNRGLFTKYCNGKVTQECIDKAKRSGNKKLIKRAVFAENSRKWSKKHQGGGWLAQRIYNSVDPTGNYPSGYGEAILLGLGAIVEGGSKKYEVTDSVADAAWRKRLGLKYDAKFLPNNKDGSVRLPKNLEKEIPVDTTFIKNRMQKNRELRNYYVEDLGRSEDNELIQVIDAANDIDKETLDSLRHTYKTGEWVTINEHANNSRQLINNGEWKLPNSPLNVLHDFGIRYNKDTRTMEYKDIYNLNKYDWGVPGEAFTIKGTVKLKKR